MTTKEFEELKQKIEVAKVKKAKAEGTKERIEAQWEKEGFHSVNEVEAEIVKTKGRIEKMKGKKEELESELEKVLKEFE